MAAVTSCENTLYVCKIDKILCYYSVNCKAESQHTREAISGAGVILGGYGCYATPESTGQCVEHQERHYSGYWGTGYTMLFSGLARSCHLNRQVGVWPRDTTVLQKSAYQCKVDIEEVIRRDPGPFQDPKNIKTIWRPGNYFVDTVVPLKGVTQRKPKNFITWGNR